MLLEGVRCIGMELEYDSEQSDWQGFDWTPPDPDPLFPSNIFKYTQLPLHATIRISTRTAWRVLMVKTVFSCLSISRNVRKIYDMGQMKMFFWVISTTWRVTFITFYTRLLLVPLRAFFWLNHHQRAAVLFTSVQPHPSSLRLLWTAVVLVIFLQKI